MVKVELKFLNSLIPNIRYRKSCLGNFLETLFNTLKVCKL